MTARPQVELPELPEPINDGSRGFGQLWNPLYSEDQMHAYAQQAIAESEARAEGLRSALSELSNMYSHAWDLVDGGLMMMESSIPRFEAAHSHAERVLRGEQ